MGLVDSNVWLALALSKHRFHSAARPWLCRQSANQPAAFCRSTQQSFLRLLTTDAVFTTYGIPALSNRSAWSVYEGFRADKRIIWIEEPRGLEAMWKQLAAGRQNSPKLWMDAYLAAFAITGDLTLVSTDRGFKQSKELELVVLA
jgi:toxin-antitoxin system PIN domain toxin